MKKDSFSNNGAQTGLPGNDDIFSINISENMEIRNILRAGLVEAQGHEPDKIPLYVSWPSWLEDGIVCMYAKDLHDLLRKTILDTAASFEKLFREHAESAPEKEVVVKPFEPQIKVKSSKETHGKKLEEARKAARDILEKPLGEKTVKRKT